MASIESEAVAPASLDEQLLARVYDETTKFRDEIRRVYLGPSDIADIMLVAVIARGHVLLEGVPASRRPRS